MGRKGLESERRTLDFTITVGLPLLPLQVMTLLYAAPLQASVSGESCIAVNSEQSAGRVSDWLTFTVQQSPLLPSERLQL